MADLSPSSTSDTRKVLVVDDEELILGVAARLLERLPVEVHTAKSGSEAVEKVAAGAFDLVMLDLTMPELDGRTTLLEIQRLRPGLPVVIMSGMSSAESVDVLDGAECQGFLPKPFGLADVRSIVQQVLV
jgi:two-component system, cell cycle sensor histidine kinase and response regulator CckA